MRSLFLSLGVALSLSAMLSCKSATPQLASSVAGNPSPGAPALASDITARLQKFPETPIDYDRTLLTEKEKEVVAKLVEASKYMDQIFFRQVSEENSSMREQLVALAANDPAYAEALQLFDVMKGRWDSLEADEPFVAPFGPAGALPKGSGFYPPDMTKDEFHNWIAAHPEDKDKFQGLFTVIRRDGDRLVARPFSEYYAALLEPAAASLREAAAMTDDESLRNYLLKRADAFLMDDYYESDIAWMDLDSSIEVVTGPYEVYQDGLFNFKAAFESFVTVVDRPASEKLAIFAQHLADMERNLPIPDEYKNPNRGSESPIKVVQVIYTAGDARRGVQTAAFNLPNDERVRESKGCKKVLLKNVMEAKFNMTARPIALRVLDESQTSQLSFDAFFSHILFHELSHGLGPGIIKDSAGNKMECRFLLKELYSTMEEAKADVLGVWNVLYAIDKALITDFSQEELFVTNVGGMYRSMRFGLHEAHGGGVALQWNWYREKGAIVSVGGDRFKVDPDKMPEAVRSLANELLMIEATGDYARASRLLESYGKATPEMEAVVSHLGDLPVDITPVYIAAGEKEVRP